jgi:hypothetical protein
MALDAFAAQKGLPVGHPTPAVVTDENSGDDADDTAAVKQKKGKRTKTVVLPPVAEGEGGYAHDMCLII